MEIIRDNFLYFIPNSQYEESKLSSLVERELRHDNPKYKLQKGYSLRWLGLTKTIETFDRVSYNGKDAFKVMKGNYKFLTKVTEEFTGISLTDNRVSCKIQCNSTKGPRDEEQEKAIKAITNFPFGYGILNSPPASGKTYIASQLITVFKERTLILIDMKLLADQFIDSLIAFTDIKREEIGMISGKEIEYGMDKKVIISTMQTLNKKKSLMRELSKTIGFIIQDECQIASCETIQGILKNFRPKYQLGLSGTPYRDDEMDFLIRESIGPIIYTTDKQNLIKKGSIIVPILRPVFLKDDKFFNKYNTDEIKFRDVVDKYYANPKVIAKVSKLICKMFDTKSQLVICKEKILVNKYHEEIIRQKFPHLIEEHAKEKEKAINEVKKELEQCETVKEKRKLEQQLRKLEKDDITDTIFLKDNPEYNSVKTLIGDFTKNERDKIIEDTNKGKIKVLITTTLLDKAISINKLDTIHLLFSTRERNNTVQRIGRTTRASAGKIVALVFDYIYDHYMSFYQFYNSKGDCRLTAHKDACKIHPSIEYFLNYLRKRFIEKDINVKIEEYEKIKHLYEIDINKEGDTN